MVHVVQHISLKCAQYRGTTFVRMQIFVGTVKIDQYQETACTRNADGDTSKSMHVSDQKLCLQAYRQLPILMFR